MSPRTLIAVLLMTLLAYFVASEQHTLFAQDRTQRYLYVANDGKLVYPADPLGNRVPDYSFCGYQAGNVAIPDVPTRVRLEAPAGDATQAIQQAIDFVSQLPIQTDGFRGAVLLGPGEFQVEGQIVLRHSGVVLRGTDSALGTTILATGQSRRTLIRIAGAGEPRLGKEIPITNVYLPVGTKQLNTAESLASKVGSSVCITHPSTLDWIASIGMNRFPTDDKGSWLDWKARNLDVRWERTINSIDHNSLTLDIPLTSSIDGKLTTGTIRSLEWPERIERIGVESLKLVSVSKSSNPKDEVHAWDSIGIEKASDVWIRDIASTGFVGSAVCILETARRISVIRCSSAAPISEHAAGRRRTFYTCGQQTLFHSCLSDSGRHDFAVGYLAAGPNAFVDCSATNAQNFSGPIESWATGILYDNVSIDGAGLSLTNREIDGQGVGWTTAHSMLWQCSAPIITCRNPPGHNNWAIGCWAGFIGDGHWKSMNEFVTPDSLFQAQHAERHSATLSNKILEAKVVDAKFNDVSAEDKKRFETWRSKLQPSVEKTLKQSLSLRNGWLYTGDQLANGNRGGTMWWRGSMLPTRTSEFGVGVTRFTPGRTGKGFTDDLDELTDSMVANSQSILEHHWGLWYDRRRDDHEMIRRLDGEVWAPFYEQPWARSGQGLAWDGLSKYDLESFNPWYFSRLREFAFYCEPKGRILLQQMYFQHNILEAGAHWADFPWRSANNIQPVGFVEPPPYANKKRIFQADEFYDIDHPVRRALHIAYIRHCLSNMIGQRNVLFSIGEEFTGPAKFVRFWLETIAEWKLEHPEATPLVCLSCTKDVQDEILADPALNKLIHVIDLKYWWYFADGAIYAPPGGANLAPRQQLREWKGKKSRSDSQTARQINEMRIRYPDKAVISQYATQNGWATIAAGGSIPSRIPAMPPTLLEVVPDMSPMPPLAGNRFCIAKAGENYLVFGMTEEGLSPDALQLPLASFDKAFAGRWLDPKSGEVLREVSLAKGKDLNEMPPNQGSHLLWLQAR